jgi:Flp pilus assembly protein TadD
MNRGPSSIGLVLFLASTCCAEAQSFDCRSFDRAVRDVCQRANIGEAAAEVELADIFASGRGVARNVREALRLYRSAAEQGNPEGMNGTAWRLVMDGGNLDEALRWASRASALAPGNAATEDTLGWILFRQGKFDLALFHARRSVALEPRCPSCEDHLGDIEAALGRRDEARPHWRRALALSEGNPPDPDWDRAAVARKLAAN